ncbi:hypothetical protein [Pseudomonas fontis]|uniref:Uncharacterized protein n=1 Tax=Pseudomonas fontis TaxID=2942633 RepID=A0ABT5NTV3_9PSED|nr:hypothetical protein [Pseudomonas fontis]MDD0974513.1 hypothetical protein [Pseudomonas fontis]MDD0991607.1 hypothetical protein [Pseudomonas fontis]
MYKQAANAHQPDICLSLTSEWLVHMMTSPDAGLEWCRKASREQEHSAFYTRHLREQAELTSMVVIDDARAKQVQREKLEEEMRLKQKDVLQRFEDYQRLPVDEQDAATLEGIRRDVTVFKTTFQTVLAQELSVVESTSLITQSLLNKTTDKVKLLEMRRLEVLAVKEPASLKTLGEELQRVEDTPRYYLISVKARADASHVLGLVSTKSPWLFGTNGMVYYYDSNLKAMLLSNGRAEMIKTLNKLLDGDYQGINHIWEIRKV